MKTFDLTDSIGRKFAFEVENSALGRRGLCKVVRLIPGAIILRSPRAFSWFREEEFCLFSLDGITFGASEPFGDNSRYWVGPELGKYAPQISVIRAVFESYTPLLDRSLTSFFKAARS